MSDTSPARGACVAWGLPVEQPPPRWLAACETALRRLCSGANVAGLRWRVELGPLPAEPLATNESDASLITAWLTDGHGAPLDPQAPLLAAITAGQGLSLALWAPAPAGGWVCLRRLHVACSPRPREAWALLPQAVARLLWQAGLQQHLGCARAVPTLPGPRRAHLPPSARWPAPVLHLRGHLRAWMQRQRARWTREQWRVGVLDRSAAALVQGEPLPAPRWLPAFAGLGYWADPAPLADSDSRILAEFFDETRGLGAIEALRLDPQGQVRERLPLPLGQGRHASFAHTFRANDGRLLGLAETAALRASELHEIDSAGRWQRIATLLPGVAAADPALFQWQGRWWLAFTDIDQGAMDNLCLYHAEQLEGPWQAHANNPVKVDVRGARMAGAFFWHEGQLYRPGQDCLATYGAAVVLYRVLHCSPTAYAEERVRVLRPDRQGPCPDGLHTLSIWGDRLLIDGKRHVFSPGLGWQKLRRRLQGWVA